MKSVGGKPVEGPKELRPLVFARGDDPEAIVFRAKPVKDFEEFNVLCPPPDPKQHGRIGRNGWEPDPDAPAYRDQLRIRNERRNLWLYIKTLEPSNIEWDKVDPEKPETWRHFQEEMEEKLTFKEIDLLIEYIEEANCLNRAALEANRERFFRAERAALNGTTPSE